MAAQQGQQGFLSVGHPVAAVAARLCRQHVGSASLELVGGVACGRCWEQAIRADERVVVWFDLPEMSPPPEPDVVDEVAVALAAAGTRRVVLTGAERVEVVGLLLSRGLTVNQIGKRLRMDHATVKRLVAKVGGQRAGACEAAPPAVVPVDQVRACLCTVPHHGVPRCSPAACTCANRRDRTLGPPHRGRRPPGDDRGRSHRTGTARLAAAGGAGHAVEVPPGGS